jgi:hypothetical protein
MACSRKREPGFGVVGQTMDEDEQREAGMTSRLLDMSHVRIRDLATFEHPRLAQAQRDLVEVVESRRVVAGFGSAI